MRRENRCSVCEQTVRGADIHGPSSVTLATPFPLEQESTKLWAIFIILIVLYVLGLVTGTTMSGFIHILLILAVVAEMIEVIRMATRRRA